MWDRNPEAWHGTAKKCWKSNWSMYGKTGKYGAAYSDGGECLGEWRSLTCHVFLIQCLLTQLLPPGEHKTNTHLVDVLSLIQLPCMSSSFPYLSLSTAGKTRVLLGDMRYPNFLSRKSTRKMQLFSPCLHSIKDLLFFMSKTGIEYMSLFEPCMQISLGSFSGLPLSQ